MKLSRSIAALALGAAPLYAQQWPLGPQDQTHAIWHGFGTFTDLGGDHYHEGIDLPAANGRTVLAVEGGWVAEKYLDGGGSGNSSFVTVPVTIALGWTYAHIDVGTNPHTGLAWAVGDVVTAGDPLGVVHDFVGLMDHLHLQLVNDGNGSWHGTGYPLAHVQGDPLDFLIPNTDGVAPTVEKELDGHFNYRKAGGTGDTGSRFTDDVFDARVIYGDTDVVARASDIFGSHAGATDYHVGVKRIRFEVDGPYGVGDIAPQTLVEFNGDFLGPENPVGFSALAEFRDLARTHLVYEDVFPMKSDGHTADDVSLDQGKYFHILTNIDDDTDLEFDDKDRYWDTNGKDGEPWNDDRSDTSHEAQRNAETEFPDGYYTLKVTAFGQGSDAGGAGTSVTDKAYVNNFSQRIRPSKIHYGVGEPVKIRGEQFRANANYTVYVVNGTNLTDGIAIPPSAAVTVTQVTTDADGRLPLTTIWSSFPGGSAYYDILIDYDGDLKYHRERNEKNIDAWACIGNPVSASTYCTAKTNSQGCVPKIFACGAPSVSGSTAFIVGAIDVINNKSGLLFYGRNGSYAASFQGGTLCVRPPLTRTRLHDSGGEPPPDDCTGLYSIDMSSWAASGRDPNLTAGTTVWCQYWSRDPASASTTGLTDALYFTYGP